MENVKISKAIAVTSILFFCSCSHNKSKEEIAAHPEAAPPKKAAASPAESSIEAKEVAAEEEAPFVSEITFVKGKSNLTTDARERITQIIAKANKKGRISELKVIAWADSEYPSVHTKKLEKSQVRLATARSEAIKKLLKSLEDEAKISTYNMAERPGALGDLVGTTNAHIKKSLEVAGIPNTDSSVKTPAKSAKAIILVVLKE